jgi:hypothetical protein
LAGGEQAERRVRPDDAALVEQRQATRGFKHPLDHEHHVRTAGVILVEHQRHIVLIGPGQNAILEFGDLHALAHDDGVLADKIDTADMAVEVDAHARPVQPRRNLLDMGRFAGAVVARHHHAAVVGEPGQNGERGIAIEQVIRIQVGDIGVPLLVGRNGDVRIDAKHFAHIDGCVRQVGDIEVDLAHHVSKAWLKKSPRAVSPVRSCFRLFA